MKMNMHPNAIHDYVVGSCVKTTNGHWIRSVDGFLDELCMMIVFLVVLLVVVFVER